ncbi:transposase [Clostridium neonatale]|uniref:transposase n=1 Tax=Clostridium neonatale TaxID=137838 RepID=UPI00291B9B81|nr:transposase [Clostridium neonatale]
MIQEDVNFEKLEGHFGKLLKCDIYKNRCIDECLYCKSKNYIKFGTYKGIQRYRCKECEKTFSKTTKSMWSYSKKQPEVWVKFVELMLQKKSLRACAKILKINIRTAFIWRHKIMRELTSDVMAEHLEGKVFIAKTIEKENFKGCRKITVLERKNIWIVAARDRRDSMIAMPVCMQFWNEDNFNKIIYSKITEDSYIVPDNDRYMMNIAKNHNKGIVLNSKLEKSVRNFRRNLRNWIGIFRGVATKYLEGYLSYFVLFNLYKKFNSLDFTYNLCLKIS